MASVGPEHEPEPPDPSGHRYDRALGARLRAVRTQRHLSLQGVERASGGRWKAVVVGSYERGDRAISVHRLAELAAFYETPLAELLPGAGAERPAAPAAALSTVVLNPRRVLELTDPAADPLIRMVTAILHRRRARPGERLAIRCDDLSALALLYDTTTALLTERLVRWQVLAPESLILDGEP